MHEQKCDASLSIEGKEIALLAYLKSEAENPATTQKKGKRRLQLKRWLLAADGNLFSIIAPAALKSFSTCKLKRV